MSGTYTMMTLGPYKFGIDTAAYQELKRSSEWLWPSQQRFGQTPVLQCAGKGDETITLPGVIYPEWRGSTLEIEDMRALGDGKIPLALIDGRGNVLGKWVITNLEETHSVFAQAGVGRKQEFTLTLKRFGDVTPSGLPDDATGAGAGAISAVGSQLSGAVSSPLPAIPSVLDSAKAAVASASATANAALSAASRITGQVGGALSQVNRIASTLGIHAPAIVKALNRSMSAVNSIRTASGDGLDLLRKVQTVSSAASAASSMFSAATSQAQPAAQSSASIKASLASLQGAGAASDTLATVTTALVSANRVTALASSLRDNTNTIIKRIGG